MPFCDKLLVAVAAFDPADVVGDGQPDPGMAERSAAAVAGDAFRGDDFGFWRVDWHDSGSFWAELRSAAQ